jgi:hypothetical protein
MKLPSFSKLFAPIPDPNAVPPPRVEAVRTIRRIGVLAMGDSIYDAWLAVFGNDPSRVVLSSARLEDAAQRVHLTLAKPGDRLRTVHVGGNLVAVENLDLE